ncbi:MAG: Ty1/Copia family ribonuclease HI [Sweet potato little leaf phytoplasma]|nr:Ty1/Copia family ribonuclease HI [Sweet potato little leaf phytoplasma]
MGNSATAGVLGKGKVLLKLTSGKILSLNDVLYVPSLRRNLVFGSLLNRAGLRVVFEADNVVITKNSDFVGGATSWKSAKQTCIARSTMESEFIALELAGQEAEWLRSLLQDVPLWGASVPVSLHCDSQAAIGIAKSSVYNGKRRHIRLRHGVVKQLLKSGIISLEYVRSERNLTDPLTKGLRRRVILESSASMGLKLLK